MLFFFISAIPVFATATSSDVPDVMILVRKMGRNTDEVAVVYNEEVEEDIVDNDMQAISDAGGWLLRGVRIDTTASDVRSARKTTSASFITQDLAIQPGTLPIAPFITALKRYDKIEIMFSRSEDFEYSGPVTFNSPYVAVEYRPGGSMHVFSVRITDRSFDKLDLPLVKEDEKTHAKPTSLPVWTRVLIVAVLAVVMAILVYMIVIKRNQSQKDTRGK